MSGRKSQEPNVVKMYGKPSARIRTTWMSESPNSELIQLLPCHLHKPQRWFFIPRVSHSVFRWPRMWEIIFTFGIITAIKKKLYNIRNIAHVEINRNFFFFGIELEQIWSLFIQIDLNILIDVFCWSYWHFEDDDLGHWF